jgi:tetratricopeptide (TPR) repeat protein
MSNSNRLTSKTHES